MSLFAPEPAYDADGITLYSGDCLTLMHDLRTPVDAVIADLPYGTTRNHWDRELPNKLLWHGYHSIARPGAAVVLFGSGSFTARVITENLPEYRYTLIWAKRDPAETVVTRAIARLRRGGDEETPERDLRAELWPGADVSGYLNAKKQPLRIHEDLAVFHVGGKQPSYTPQMVFTGREAHGRGSSVERTVNHYGHNVNTPVVDQGGHQHPHSVLDFRRPKLPKGAGHPSQKPVDLMRWLIRTYTQPGDLVLDNVCGSGTTLVAARAEGRRAIGIELNPEFVDMAAARLGSGKEGDRW